MTKLPKGWKEEKLNNCINNVSYTKKIKKKDYLNEGKYPIISQEDSLINGYWNDLNDLFIIKKPIVIFGDHTKVIKYIDFNFVLGADGVKILDVKDHIYPKYFYYLLNSFDIFNLGYSRHFRIIKEKDCPLPPLSEQKRIVEILDKAFEEIEKAKANYEKNLNNAKELFQSKLDEIFSTKGEGWEEKKLGDVTDLVRGPFGGSLKKNIFKKDGFAVYEQQHAIYNQFKKIRYFIDENKFNEMKRFEVLEGDLIMSCSGTMGKIAIVPKGIKKGIINQALLKITPKKNIIDQFILLYFKSSYFYSKLTENSKGAAIKNVASVKILKQLEIPVPNILEQQLIINNLDKLKTETQKLEKTYIKQLENLEELKKSLLDKAFKGEL